VLLSDLAGKNVAILGAGREGLAARDRLRASSPGQAVTLYSEDPVSSETRRRLEPKDRLLIGPLDGDRLSGHEVIIRSPGVSPYRAPCRAARQAGVRFTSGTDLWLADHPRARTLGITGTKGKSTTTALLAHLLSAAGERVGVAGNIGVPLMACDADEADWWVVELSSYQLCDLCHGPWLGLLLNLSDEHLDWHGGAEAYRRDKLRLATLAPEGRRVVNAGDPALVEALADLPGVTWFNTPGGLQVRDGALYDGDRRLPAPAGLPGTHNLHNLAAALAVTDLLDRRPENLAVALGSFRGLPHRLSAIGARAGRRLVDDSLSTTPVATLAALDALRGRPVTVLVGGLDRGIDWSSHAPAFRAAAPHALVGLPDSGPAILAALEGAGLTPPGGMHSEADMAAAVRRALAVTPPDGIVLLSPGAPSFPRFRDYRERAEAFARAALGGEHGKVR